MRPSGIMFFHVGGISIEYFSLALALCCSCHFAYRSIDDSDALGVQTGIHVRLIHGSVTEPIWVFDR
jgi:hypothetical protein